MIMVVRLELRNYIGLAITITECFIFKGDSDDSLYIGSNVEGIKNQHKVVSFLYE